jgi:(1->4)-alpha-D-glucan 1-alpha-D-glucosylmutase
LPGSSAQLARKAAELKTQLAQIVSTNESVQSALQTALQRFQGAPGQLESWTKLDALIRKQNWRPTHFRVASDDINYRRFFNISELAGIRMELPEVFEQTHQLVFKLLAEGNLQGLRIDHVDGLYDPKEYLDRLRNPASSLERSLQRKNNLVRKQNVRLIQHIGDTSDCTPYSIGITQSIYTSGAAC